MIGRASTSSSFNYQWTYDVFINFRGEDTRRGFTGNLYNALCQEEVRTFLDDEELRKGDEIRPTLLKAIEESRMAIIVFSKNYASSTFCLDELVKIIQCIKGSSRLVWPIFYDVDPSEVRHQKGNYKEALAKHEKNFKADKKKLQSWKLALSEAADISGLHFTFGHGEYEYQFIERIVKEISSQIKRVPLHVAKHPVGLDYRVQKINSLLQVWSNKEVNMVGICGIGGIGKSTIARALYNSNADYFEDGIQIIIQDDLSKHIEVNWDGEAFKDMKNLKILIFGNAKFSESPKYLPNSLIVLKWPGYPSSWLPPNFCPRKLLVYEMPHSRLNSLEPIKANSLSYVYLFG